MRLKYHRTVRIARPNVPFPERAARWSGMVSRVEHRMDVVKMLADLRQEREQIEEAIISLERLAQGRGKRRGRPPSWLVEAKKRGRPLASKNRNPSLVKPAVA